MERSTGIAVTCAVIATAAAVWLFVENRALRANAAQTSQVSAAPDVATTRPKRVPPRLAAPNQERPSLPTSRGPAPRLENPEAESRLERRARRTDNMADFFARLDDESDEDYQLRIQSMVGLATAIPKQEAAAMRAEAEAKAAVTVEQRAQLDEVVNAAYAAALEYTAAAITDGVLSPYQRNVAGWLEFAGGLGGLLGETEGRVGGILSPAQQQVLYDSGFDWGEYLAASAPWEQLPAPPAPSP